MSSQDSPSTPQTLNNQSTPPAMNAAATSVLAAGFVGATPESEFLQHLLKHVSSGAKSEDWNTSSPFPKSNDNADSDSDDDQPVVCNTIAQRNILKKAKKDIHDSLEDQLLSINDLPSKVEYVEVMARNPLKSYIALLSSAGARSARAHMETRRDQREIEKSDLDKTYANIRTDQGECRRLLTEHQALVDKLQQQLDAAKHQVANLEQQVIQNDAEMSQMEADARQLVKDQQVSDFVEGVLDYIHNLHQNKRFNLPYAKLHHGSEELKAVAKSFGVTDYDSIKVMSTRCLANIGRSLRVLGFEYSPAYLRANLKVLKADKSVEKDELVNQTCKCFDIHQPGQYPTKRNRNSPFSLDENTQSTKKRKVAHSPEHDLKVLLNSAQGKQFAAQVVAAVMCYSPATQGRLDLDDAAVDSKPAATGP